MSNVEKFSYIGKSIERVDGRIKVSGAAKFGSDLKLPGMLFGKFLKSKYAQARILNIDASRAISLPGVKAVVTGKDIPLLFGMRYAGAIDQPIFAIDKVRYWGEPVAGVAAVDDDTAEEALALITVVYEELPAVFDPLEAMTLDAPLVHENFHLYKHGLPTFEKPSNICYDVKLRSGNIEQGFSESDFIFEDTFRTPLAAHCCMETHTAVAEVDSSGRVILWTCTGTPWRLRAAFSESFDIPMAKIRIITPWQGGDFGSKNGLTVEPRAYALALKTNGKPVKVVWSREEEFTSTLVRHAAIIEMKTGVKRDGTLCSRRVKIIWDTGAYLDRGPMVCQNGTLASTGPYRIPNVHVDGYCVYTNNPIASAFRGFGVPQVTWAFESQMDIISEKLKIDPLKLRLRNVFKNGDISPMGTTLKAVGVGECLRKAAEGIGWQGRGNKRNRGVGIACMHKIQLTETSAALLKVEQDGSVVLSIGGPEVGQGCDTIFSQMVAEELEVSIEDVTVAAPRDTDLQLQAAGASGSGMTFMLGPAVIRAARDAREQLFELAARLLEVDKDNLILKRGAVFNRDIPEQRITLGELALKAFSRPEGPVIGKGVCSYPSKHADKKTGQGLETVWMYGAQAIEVEVDRETGTVKVLRVAAAHDVGRAINPKLCEAQLEGAIAMGLGTTLWEEVIVEKGRILNPKFTDYKLTTALDITEIYPIIVEEAHDQGPYGAKGVGEPALAPTAVAIANAVYDAVGIRIKNFPLTAERILKTLKER